MNTRRQFLRLAPLSLLSGCCSLDRSFVASQVHLPDGMLIIDPHCHVFNGRDLNIAAYMDSERGKPGSEYYLPYKVAGHVLHFLAQTIREKAWTAEAELDELTSMNRRSTMRMDSRTRNALPPGTQSQRAEDAMREAENEVGAALESATRRDVRGALEAARTPRMPESTLETEAVRKEALRAYQSADRHHPLKAYSYRRWVNARNLMLTYPEVDLFTPAMLDVDSWLAADRWGIPSTPMDLQVRVMEEISVMSGGKIHGFVGYCPRHQATAVASGVAANRTPLGVVKRAISRGGHLGVKLYPVMGYQPWGNATLSSFPPGHDTPPSGAELDAAMAQLYTECLELHSAPIMAHTNASHGTSELFEMRASPLQWKPVMNKFEGLTINLAHFGGHALESWTDESVEMMGVAEHRVFSDFSCFTEVRCSRFATLLEKRIEQWRGESRYIAARMMYGSDWYMLTGADILSKKGKGIGPTYLKRWYHALEKNQIPQDIVANIFGRNAADYLGLRDSRVLDRIDTFHEDRGIPQPRWRNRVPHEVRSSFAEPTRTA